MNKILGYARKRIAFGMDDNSRGSERQVFQYDGNIIFHRLQDVLMTPARWLIAGWSLGIGTMISRDILPHAKESGTLLRTRMVVLAVILLAAIVAVMNKDSQVLLWNYMSMALRGGGIFLPLTLTIFRQHAVGSHCAILSMTISTAVAVIAAIVDSPVPPLFIGLGTSFLFLAAGYITHHGEAGLSAR